MKELNNYISVEELTSLLANELARFGDEIGCPVFLEQLGAPRGRPDSPTMALVKAITGQPKAVISFARSISPDLVMRGVKNAKSVRSLLGNDLSEAIINPLSYH